MRTNDLCHILKIPHLKWLCLNRNIKKISKKELPEQLTHLIIGDGFYRSIDDELPDNLTHLTFC